MESCDLRNHHMVGEKGRNEKKQRKMEEYFGNEKITTDVIKHCQEEQQCTLDSQYINRSEHDASTAEIVVCIRKYITESVVIDIEN